MQWILILVVTLINVELVAGAPARLVTPRSATLLPIEFYKVWSACKLSILTGSAWMASEWRLLVALLATESHSLHNGHSRSWITRRVRPLVRSLRGISLLRCCLLENFEPTRIQLTGFPLRLFNENIRENYVTLFFFLVVIWTYMFRVDKISLLKKNWFLKHTSIVLIFRIFLTFNYFVTWKYRTFVPR